MMTIGVIFAIWVRLSLPMSVILGHSIKRDGEPELVGMDGDIALFRRPDGSVQRVSLTQRSVA